MFKLLIMLVTSTSFAYASNCIDLYNTRGESLATTLKAYDCYNDLNQTGINNIDKSINLNKMAYLKFLQASLFEDDRINSLFKSFTLAKDSIKLYAPIFNRVEVMKLPEQQIEIIALSYYLYGTAVSKYVDLKGKYEAIKRKNEIKNTMTMILGLKKPSTFHYGAYRNLAIYNLKVPRIAGGKLSLSGTFFEKLMQESKTAINISSYPVGHIYYAEYLRRIGKSEQACEELDLVKSLTDEEIETYFQDLKYETKNDRILAQKKFEQYSC